MNCQEVIDFLSEYLDGTLPWHRRALFWLHMRLCPDCRNYFASFCRTLALVRTTARDFASDQLPAIPPELVQAIQAARK
jgi:predicted anti-sigma-YlaC factor YlaD